jgi:predicted nucleic acid-binding protein
MYTFDTNPIIYYIDDEPAAVAMLDDLFMQEVPLYTSTITELELFSYPALTEAEEVRIEAFLRRVRIIPVFSNIARIAGDLRRLYPRLKGFDSAVAATALFANSTLVTRNIRDFEQIEGLSLLAI